MGALGERGFAQGYYVYAGSAFAAGGLRARLLRHWSGGRNHWHVDYLRAYSELVQIWWTVDPRSRERDWALTLTHWLGDSPVSGFGASDSPLVSHLFFSRAIPRFAAFRRRVVTGYTGHAPVHCTVLTSNEHGPGST
ncbi:MAG: GIY-YIG nuclease family protein [Gammaproteobacteria bacterium]|nr:GIY-YIG nuclease family protein [Gammaproteobacteria bacterium]